MCKRYWYVLSPSTANPLTPTNYFVLNGSPICTTPGALICSIYACACNVYPCPDQFEMGHNMYDYIVTALVSPYLPQPDGAGQKIYVYTRPSV